MFKSSGGLGFKGLGALGFEGLGCKGGVLEFAGVRV